MQKKPNIKKAAEIGNYQFLFYKKYGRFPIDKKELDQFINDLNKGK